MNRQQAQQTQQQGVVLTGYHSNAELVPKREAPGAHRTGHYTVQQNHNDRNGADNRPTSPRLHPPQSTAADASSSSPRLHPPQSPRAENSSSTPKPELSSSPKMPHHPPSTCPRPEHTGLHHPQSSGTGLYAVQLTGLSGRAGDGRLLEKVENITRSADGEKRGEGESQEEENNKPPEEGEQEEAWLEQDEDSAAFLSTLTRSQAAAIERRVQQTLRRRNRQHVPDVRDIFRPPQHHKVLEKSSEENGRIEKDPKEVSSPSETDTELNVEVAFSEQALNYRENHQGLKKSSSISADDKLPNFKLLRDKTGQTRIGDLSPPDMKKVQRLVLVEMTALFDTAGIDIKAQKAVKIRTKESGVFGVPLTTLLEQDQKKIPGTKVPIILQKLISHIEGEGLDTEGLLRIPGAATRVKALCQELESSFYDSLFSWSQLKQHDAASLLKLFIRELPHPLLTVEHLNAFISVNNLPTKKHQLQALNLLVLLLPEPNRDTLKALVEFFRRVIERQAHNRMTLNNVSVVMAPNLFMFKGQRAKVTQQQEVSMATGTANIVRLLIRYQDLLWTFIMTQVRQQNMESQRKQNKERAVRKLLKKITTDKQPEKSIPEESSQGFIRVQAPQFSKVSMAVQLTEELQAADVLTRFLSQDNLESVKRDELCLYEIGGNIKERCLDGETYMKDLFQLNPAAEWVIRVVQR
ncbi:hypothetical protein WMY93_014433 [Mugilogobius chulae]|uniref:Rho-GAP domain-containing protein n=1 Tax=Mugilogobius chulae TaxID=88201 RepID=A0AAW0NVJ2_9GOBI